MGAIDSRARFEEWITKSYPDRDLERHEDGSYAYAFASLAWEAWSAALTPSEGWDQSLLELVAAFETDLWADAYLHEALPLIKAALLAAQPEVKP